MKLKCLYPFTYFEINTQGWVYVCCPAWTKAGPIGNIKKKSFEEIWNSPKAQKIRGNIYQNNLKEICNEQYCPVYLSSKNLSLKKWQKINPEIKPILKDLKNKKTKLSSGPINVNIADSGKCNLRCKMCISNQDFNPPDEKLSKRIFNDVLPKLLKDIRILTFSGNGEVFFRKESREFLENFNQDKYPKLEFNILSNGLLLNEKAWEKIKHNRFNAISISIDAANPETYKKIRGGNWDILQNNLKLLGKLRKENEFKWFQINFVVMKSNYKEIKDFALMGKKLGCDQVVFSKIFGHTPGCLEENINLFPNPKIFLKIKEILKEPIFKNHIINITELKVYKEYKFNKKEKIKDIKNKIKKSLVAPLFKIYYKIPLRYRPLRYLKNLIR